jgi:hypothetical protein
MSAGRAGGSCRRLTRTWFFQATPILCVPDPQTGSPGIADRARRSPRHWLTGLLRSLAELTVGSLDENDVPMSAGSYRPDAK